MDIADILVLIADLMSEDGENEEYDRACVEMATRVLRLPIDDFRESVTAMLKAMKKVL